MMTRSQMLGLPATFFRYLWYGRGSLFGASFCMFEISFFSSLLLAWIPVVGPFLGPVLGGLTGGRRAGTPGRALLAAILPAVVLSLLILALGAAAAHYARTPLVGALAALLAGAAGVVIVIHNLLLFASALAGGLMRSRETR